MKLVYNVSDKPKFGKIIVFALQQLLAIMAATIAVPSMVGHGLTADAALFGAGCGTIIYLLFTMFKSPVFLGSSFAFIGSMAAAFAGSVSMQLGYLGLIIGAVFAGLVYVIIAIVVKFAGVNWIDKLMPAVVIGPTVAIIGLSLSSDAVGKFFNYAGNYSDDLGAFIMDAKSLLCLACALVTLAVTMICATYGKKMMKLIPFIIGILAGYAVAAILTVFGIIFKADPLKIIDFAVFKDLKIFALPNFVFLEGFKGFKEINASYIISILVAYVPVAFVVFAEHLADHKNLSSIIESDLTKDPGLARTLLGDGIGSMVGAFFGGCPNTTYGESIGCVAITGNASTISILGAAILAIAVAFIGPFVAFLNSIPSCVMGGVCLALYGFIAVSGLKMLQPVDLGENKNLFTASVILIAGVGNLALAFSVGNGQYITLRTVACALILGILTNVMLSAKSKKNEQAPEEPAAEEPSIEEPVENKEAE